MINFQKSTFICLDIPNKMAIKIRQIRQILDTQIAWKPVVITIAGSSGCGHISDEQDIFKANEIIKNLVKNISPFNLEFSIINSFPGTDIFYFEFENDKVLNQIHNKVKNCGINFFENKFPFKAHCTIHFKGKMTIDKKKQIEQIVIPKEKFKINTLSLISDYEYLFRFKLIGS